ncbi:MAG: hypothetical protein E7599_02335 [Ruminococcaceae bacterium]|nr:hypothetical protein [Oscillospiraceae bacterium]
MKKSFQFATMILAAALLFSGCAGKTVENGNNENEIKEEVNKFINSEPGRLQTGECLDEDAVRINCTDYAEYRRQIAQEDTSAGWLSWEQFSALGEFYSAGWWQGDPQGCQYKYLHTDPATGKTWLYSVYFEIMPSTVTNIKEYWQWYFGSEWDSTEEYVGGWNRRMRVNMPSISPDAFPDSDLTNIDPNDSIFANCKNKYGDFSYYVDDILDLSYYVSLNGGKDLDFVYDGWRITIYKKTSDGTKSGILDNTDPEILQKLVNANTYKEAIAELMDPANGNYDK